MAIEIEKAEGHDWVVTYQYEGEPIEVMSVFGQNTIESAIEEARLSLTFVEEDESLAILKVERWGLPELLADSPPDQTDESDEPLPPA